MIGKLKITVLTDNYVATPDLLAEHGLAVLVEADGRRVLFDTGQSGVLRRNAEALGVGLRELDAVVLSHGHYDHTGGLAELLHECTPGAIFLHPAAMEPKYLRSRGERERPIGMPEDSRRALDGLRERIVWTESVTEVAPGIRCSGEIPRAAGNAQATAGFFLDSEGRRPDPVADDQALLMDSAEGQVVVAGCAHSGIVNTLERARALSGRGGIALLMGGFHLGRAPGEQLEAAAEAMADCRALGPCHCTGLNAQAHLRARFPGRVREVGVGTRIRIPGAA
jgi:7,8-dihydropterin-6-yl-methyl-4-(beta-D-ribofuranosyl)aminobenzene 5'-phosphate synthase